VIDDDAFLSIVDPDAYETFVSEDWDFEQMEGHFTGQMASRRRLLRGTGETGNCQISVAFAPSEVRGFREAAGPIVATRGRLLLINYSSLTMAAQFADVTLPEPHDGDQIVTLEAGSYHCRIVQLRDPDAFADDPEEGDPDFIIELVRSDDPPPIWTGIRWLSH
jgi:hypothetical protein